MSRRRTRPPKPRPSHWVVSHEATHHDLVRGQELTFEDFTVVQGSDGQRKHMRRARFLEQVTPYHGEGSPWYTCVEVGNEEGSGPTRSIHPDQVRKIWRTTKKAPVSRKQRLKERKK